MPKQKKQEGLMPVHGLGELRERIDAIDAALVKLLQERGRCSQQVGAIKKKGNDSTFFVPFREAQVLQLCAALKDKNGMTATLLQGIYREILSASRHIQQPECVGVWQEAALLPARDRFGSAAQYRIFSRVFALLEAVEQQKISYGIVSTKALICPYGWRLMRALHKRHLFITEAMPLQRSIQPADDKGQESIAFEKYAVCIAANIQAANAEHVALFGVQGKGHEWKKIVTQLQHVGYERVILLDTHSQSKRHVLQKRWLVLAFAQSAGEGNMLCSKETLNIAAEKVGDAAELVFPLGYISVTSL